MGFIISDLGDSNRTLAVNFWNWRPTVEIIRSAALIDEERLQQLHEQCSFVRVDLTEARAIAKVLRETVLPSISPGSRLLLDGSVTPAPDDFVFHREDHELHENYSATQAWLTEFTEFCEVCSGFNVG